MNPHEVNLSPTATWHDVTRATLHTNVDWLKRYGDYRKDTVETLIESSRQQRCPMCQVKSLGSTNPSSDLDFNVFGLEAQAMVREFHKTFEDLTCHPRLNSTPTSIRLYAYPFIQPEQFLPKGCYKSLTYQNQNYHYLIPCQATPEEQANDVFHQHVWAAMKLMRFLSVAEVDAWLKRLNSYWEHVFFEARKRWVDETFSTDLASYLSALDQVRKVLEVQSRPTADQVTAIKDAISRANTHAPETYYSQGAFLHIVVNQQMKTQVNLSPAEYLDSAIENVGDMLKALGHEDQCSLLVVDASKYWARALSACSKLTSKPSKREWESAQSIVTSVRGQSVAADLREQKVTELLQAIQLKQCTVSKVREHILEFLGQVLHEHPSG